jgi:peptide/nickel transport system permease protein
MLGYFARRMLVVLLPTLLGVSIVVFTIVHLIPGSFVDILLGVSGDVTPEQVAHINQTYGLDQPLPLQYVLWLKNVVTGDLGRSLRTRRPVVTEIADALPVTLELSALSLLISLCAAVPAGVIAASRRNSAVDAIARLLALVGLSLPNFLVGTLLVLFVSLYLPILPTTGFVPLSQGLWPNLRAMILPALALGFVLIASTMRMVRSSLLDEMQEEYATVARAKGLANRTVLLRHELRNALLPIVTNVGIQMGYLLGGTIIVEQLFALPGIGRLGFNAISNRDYPLVQGVVLFMATAFTLVNLLTDVLYGWLDPRIRQAGQALSSR